MPQPINPLVRIAQLNVNTPTTGRPNKQAPSTPFTTIGWDKDQIVAGNHLNYIFDNLAQYIEWLQEQKDDLKTYIDQQDAATLQSSKDYTDQKATELDADITSLENTTLTAGDGLDGGGNLTENRTFSVDNTVVRTSRKVNNKPLSTDITLAAGDITGASTSVLTGTIADGGTIAPPSGYTVGQCKFFVSLNDSGSSGWDLTENDTALQLRIQCSVNTSGKVVCKRTVNDQSTGQTVTSATANYMVIGVK